MAQHPQQALYACNVCDNGEADSECWKCGGSGYLLWEDLEPEEQRLIEIRWEEEMKEEAV